MTIFEQINQIPLETILTALGVAFTESGTTLCLMENWNATDGWKWDSVKWIVSDFAGKRAFGDRLSFTEKHLGISRHDAILWLKDRFHLIDEEGAASDDVVKPKASTVQSVDQKKAVRDKWASFGELDAEQITYMESRKIDYHKVKKYAKDNNGYIACAIWDMTGIISIQNRAVKEKKFVIEKGSNSRGCFMSDIDSNMKKVYVVEGMFDFLSLAQYSKNVIGLKSATDGHDVIRQLYHKGYKIILIPDADEAGQNIVKALSDIKFSLLDLAKFEVKDTNELLVTTNLGADIMNFIEQEREMEPMNIDGAFSKLSNIQTIYRKNGGRLGQSSPFEALDRWTQGIIKGKVYTIGAYSNVGKSQFSYEYAQYFMKGGKKVMYFSIEVDTGMLLAYIAKSLYKKDFQDIMSGKLQINKDHFTTLSLYDNVNTLEWIIKIVDLEKPDFVFIDYVQGINCPGSSEYERLSKLALDMQQMAIRNDIVVFSISQVNNESRSKDGVSSTLKGSGGLFSSSDVIFILYEESGIIKLDITKNKFWKKPKWFIVDINFENWNVSVTPWLYSNNKSI